MPLSPQDRTILYGALRSELNRLSVQDIRNTVAAAGFDVSQITAKAEAKSGLGSRAEVMPTVDRLYGQMPENQQEVALCILAERLIGYNNELDSSVKAILGQHGFQYVGGTFVPVAVLDARESQFIPSSAAQELARAMSRLLDGDYSGAITSACGAVDLVTQNIYEKYNLGDPGKSSFQTKVNTALQRQNVFETMAQEFEQIEMKPSDISTLIEEMRKAINHAAQALQILRRAMGDTHGSKPALRQTAYDAIKWSSAICGILECADKKHA